MRYRLSAVIAVVVLAVCSCSTSSNTKDPGSGKINGPETGPSGSATADKPTDSDKPKKAGSTDPNKGKQKQYDLLKSAKQIRESRQKEKQKHRQMFVPPQPPNEASKTIDGELDDWEGQSFRDFDSEDLIRSGEAFWSGPEDASFRVAVDSDPGYVYFAIEVTDETVLETGSRQTPPDGVVLNLRDPALKSLTDKLPESLVKQKEIVPERSIVLTPDGQFRDASRDRKRQLYRAGIRAEPHATDDGYRIEVGLSVEVFQQAVQFPMEEVAFQVEVKDGDEPKRPGEQTRLGLFPKRQKVEGARYMLFSTPGLLPHEKLASAAPSKDALGVWKLDKEGWSFTLLESFSNKWHDVSDATEALRKKLTETQAICDSAVSDTEILNAYESQGGSRRVALVMCSYRMPKDSCSDEAESTLHFARFKKQSGYESGWNLARTRRIGDKKMSQCGFTKSEDYRRGEPYYHYFRLLPLDQTELPLWGIAWKKTYPAGGGPVTRRKGVWLGDFNHMKKPDKPLPVTGIDLERASVGATYRELTTNNAYLTPVDDNEGRDFCGVQVYREQTCSGPDKACQTMPRGKEVTNQILRWNREEGTFKKMFVSRNENCTADFDFTANDAYMLLLWQDRVYVVPSPKTE